MPRVVRLAPRARHDLSAIRRWQTQRGSGAAAQRRVLVILAAIDRLAEFPCLGAMGDHAGRREVSCQGHRIIYRVDPDTNSNATAGNVTVLRVFGPGQSRDRS